MTTGLFNYIDPTSSLDDNGNRVKPWAKVDVDHTSFERSQHKRNVVDIRNAASITAFGVDLSGFDVFKSPAKETEFTDDAAVRNGYYGEVEALLKERIPEIKKVVIFDHTIRRREKSSPRQPVQQVHVDQTPGAAEARVRRHTDPSETEELLKGRYQIINVWRPIGHPATDFPLAVVDYRTTKPEDMIKVDLLYPKREDNDDDDRGKEVLPDASTLRSTEGYQIKGETYSVAPNDGHKFYYAKDMTPEEVMLIKCFDSKSEVHEGGQHGLAGYTPHTAFVDPATPADAKGRQSIELHWFLNSRSLFAPLTVFTSMLNRTVVTVLQFVQFINSTLDLTSSRFLFVTNENFDILGQVKMVTHHTCFVIGAALAKGNGPKLPNKPEKSEHGWSLCRLNREGVQVMILNFHARIVAIMKACIFVHPPTCPPTSSLVEQIDTRRIALAPIAGIYQENNPEGWDEDADEWLDFDIFSNIKVLARSEYTDHHEVCWTVVCNDLSNDDVGGSERTITAYGRVFDFESGEDIGYCVGELGNPLRWSSSDNDGESGSDDNMGRTEYIKPF
ncbi:7alpha-cephem-methoxylase P8 chain [Fusarium denticulatum]|uniref:7alpha-cephem-methoxylase P8 chain n=1 Tax=Fusarium denticulatum TaxID=48507 RepID=A0A8H5TLG9_9HYPO|nr:7alpha-cephem-methoxylase P8 chain [Fusarium denticulatum]